MALFHFFLSCFMLLSGFSNANESESYLQTINERGKLKRSSITQTRICTDRDKHEFEWLYLC